MHATLTRIAASQHGVFSRQQARLAGYTERRIELAIGRGAWLRCASAVYRVSGAPLTFMASAWVAALAAGDGAMFSHRSAGQLRKLDGVPLPTRFEMYARPGARPRPVPFGALHRSPPHAGPAELIYGLPVAPLPLTIIDLARSLPPENGARIVADAIRTRQVTPAALDVELAAASARNGIARARRALWLADPRLESILEDELLHLIAPARLKVVPQFEVFFDGVFVARVDFAIRELRLALEADGFATHARRPGFERDRERLALLQLAGWVSLAFTAAQIRQRPTWVYDVITRRAEQRAVELGVSRS